MDILQDTEHALDDQVRVTSTLVKLLPPPEVKIFGNLCEKAKYGWRWE